MEPRFTRRERARTFSKTRDFRRGFTLDGALAVAANERLDEFDLFDLLSSLVDKSLVQGELRGDEVRYRLLETTRAYALEKLDAAGERDRVATLHLNYLRRLFAQRLEENERTARAAGLIAALRVELEDVRFALDRALTESELLDGGELLANVDRVWRDLGLETEGMARCEAFLNVLPGSEVRLRAKLLNVLSWLLGDSFRKRRAFEVATSAVEHARESGDGATLARSLSYLALAATFLHRFEEAEAALSEADAIPDLSNGVRIELTDTRAHVNRFRGDLDGAARTFERLRRERRSIGDAGSIPTAILAEVEHARGRTEQAIAIVRETLPAARLGTDKRTLATLLVNLAGYLIAKGDFGGALAAAREAIQIRAAREPDRVGVGVAIEHLALVLALRGDLACAAVLEGFAGAAFERHGYLREYTEMTSYLRLNGLLLAGLASLERERLTSEGSTLTPEAVITLALAQDV